MKKAVAIIVERGGMILLGKERKEGSMLNEQWHIPGETVKRNETDRDAIKRGMQEETGVKVNRIRFICSFHAPNETLVNWYHCKTSEKHLVATSDLEKAR
jgi:ADP-ribose pyrophosphatase YjhB (NUDIX family)